MNLAPLKRCLPAGPPARGLLALFLSTAALGGLGYAFDLISYFSIWAGDHETIAHALVPLLSLLLFALAACSLLRRREMAKKLAAMEARYRALFENSADAIVLTDVNSGAMVDFNGRAHKNLGFSREAFGKLAISDFDTRANRRNVEKHNSRIAEKGFDVFETEHRTASGESRNIIVSANLISAGEKQLSQSRFHDITDLRRAEAELKGYQDRLELLVDERTAELARLNEKLAIEIDSHVQTEEILKGKELFLRGVFDAIQDGITVLDCDLNVVRSNRWMQEKYPHSLPHVGRKCYEVFQNQHTSCSFCPSVHAIESGIFQVNIVPFPNPKSPTGWLELSAFPIKNNRGEVIGAIEHIKDVTLKKAAEEALRESESRLSAIIDIFEGFIYIATADYRIEFMNKALVERTGYDASGQLCHKALHGLDTPCPWCENHSVFSGETRKWEVKSPLDDRWYYTVDTPIFDGDGRVVKKQAMVIDITQQKLTQEALKESEENLRKENIILKSSIRDRYKFGGIVGKSAPMQTVYNLIVQAAASDANVIVYGESGTGKELVARAIHDRAEKGNGSFVPVNCGAIPENLLESEFFGYRKGAFTGATKDKAGYLDQADGGTLFLDEIGELGLTMQVKLLRAIEGGGFQPVGGDGLRKTNIRIIAATNRNLPDHVKNGLMREDFFYRIHVIPIHLPPLRERREDLLLLVDHFLTRHQEGAPSIRIPAKVLDAMQNYQWPGNIRELQNVLHRYLTLNELAFMGPQHEAGRNLASGENPEAETVFPLKDAVSSFEKRHLIKALAETNWHRKDAATLLGIDRRTLQRKMKSYRIGRGRQ